MNRSNPLMAAGILLASSLSTMAQAENIKVYAAASLTNAMGDIAKQFEKTHPRTTVTSVFGASSVLAKQVEAGAPADLFFSADEKWMDYLVSKNKVTANQPVALLNNQLVVIAPKGRTFSFKAQPTFRFDQAFKGHVCTGQLESVPAGIYAKQSLIKLNWLDNLQGRIVETDDVRGALAFVERGECAAGIVYATDAKISRKVSVVGVLPESTHQPIIYPVALTMQGQSKREAQQFLHYLKSSPVARATFQHYGFAIKP